MLKIISTPKTIKIPREAVLFLRDRLDKHEGSSSKKLPIRYGLAYAYLLDGAYAHANQQIKSLLKNDMNDAAYLLLAAKLKTEQSKYDDAFVIFKKAYELLVKDLKNKGNLIYSET